MARGEVGEAVGAADGLDVVHVALAAKVAGRRQVDLERLRRVTRKKREAQGQFHGTQQSGNERLFLNENVNATFLHEFSIGARVH